MNTSKQDIAQNAHSASGRKIKQGDPSQSRYGNTYFAPSTRHMPALEHELLEALLHEVRMLRNVVESQDKSVRDYDRPLSRDEAAEYLGIHPAALYKWAVEQGRIAYSRLGDGRRAALRFTRQDLDVFVSVSRIPAVEDFM